LPNQAPNWIKPRLLTESHGRSHREMKGEPYPFLLRLCGVDSPPPPLHRGESKPLASVRTATMATLHIEHGISDFAVWKAAFDRFSSKRLEAGCTVHRIYRPHDNPAYIVLQLDFPTVAQAAAFLEFLQNRVWSTPENAPALEGAPRGRIFVEASAG
jgi:hypothetical protein